MPISGPVVHQQLMHAYANQQAKLESVRGRIGQVDQDRSELDEDRSESMVQLAEHYLPELTPQAVRDTWREVRPSISQILQRKEQHASQVSAQLDELSLTRQQLDQQLLDLNAELDQATEAQQDLAQQVEHQLRQNPTFVELSDRAAMAEAALERAEANLQEIQQDAEKKLPAYHNSALFRYLQDQGFGTPQYQRRGFTRRMDRMVARLIDYRQASQSYEFLVRTPAQMQRIIDEDRAALDTVMDELEQQRDRVAEQLGLPAKINAVERLETSRSEQLSSLDRLLQQIENLQHQLLDLDDSRGTYYREAIELFRNMLLQHDYRELKRRAERTSEITDDEIVARLAGVESDIQELETATRQRRKDLRKMQRALDNLGRLIQRFRAAKFDSSRSQFVGSLDILEDVERAVDSDDIDWLWDRLRKSQRWGPTAMDQITRVATHPLTQVLINAMAHAAGGALEAHARRAGHRRGRRGPGWGRNWTGTWGGDSSGWFRRRR